MSPVKFFYVNPGDDPSTKKWENSRGLGVWPSPLYASEAFSGIAGSPDPDFYAGLPGSSRQMRRA
jgi:hypothetical protein